MKHYPAWCHVENTWSQWRGGGGGGGGVKASDMNDLAFRGIKVHFPHLSPFFKAE